MNQGVNPVKVLLCLKALLLAWMIRMSVTIGTPLQSSAFKVLLLGSGELGKEVVISLQRLGVEVHAADRYDHAPAMQVAHYSYTLNMADPVELKNSSKTLNRI